MDTDEIEIILGYSLRSSKINFLGVFPRDLIPDPHSLTNFPACLVANTDRHDQPGTHWVAFYFTSSSVIEFFDSYGQPPSTYAIPITVQLVNPITLQSIYTDVCGHYCIYFLYKRSLSVPFNTIVDSLASSRSCVDNYVKLFVNHLILTHHITVPTHCTRQCSVCRCNWKK